MSESLARLTAALADRYRIERELGQGGMATVYLAEDLKHGRKVAIKVLRAELSDPMSAQRFAREVEVAARLQHPHIVPLHDSGSVTVQSRESRVEGESGQALDSGLLTLVYYVMPFVEGETLRARLARSGTLPLDEAVRFTAEIADALAKAHRAGVIHRDIKPENILLADGHALVMDFGIAKALSALTGAEGLTSAGLSLGTPAYMAPEQVAADPRVDHRADIYALGLVAYEMLAGQLPYGATTPQQQMSAHITQTPEPVQTRRPDCPDDLARLVMQCLAKNPDERWQTADEIIPLLRSLNTGPRSAMLPRPSRKPLILGIVALVALALVLTLGRRFMTPAPVAAEERSLGVLLFDNLTHDTADAYLADGLASEIATTLARVPRLEVRSPGAVRSAQRGGETDPSEIGRRLKVHNVVEGEFQRGGDKIRIAVRLVSVSSGTQRWTQSWTRPASDLLAVQEDIATAVAIAVAGQLLPAEQSELAVHPTTSPEAYDHFLRGNFQLAKRTPAGIGQAIEEYNAAVAADPSYAQAEARVSLAYGLFAEWGFQYPGLPRDSLIALAALAAGRALASDSMMADGWMALGNARFLQHPRTLDGALPALQRATEIDPRNAEAWHQYASLLLVTRQYEAAMTSYRRALALEPRRSVTWSNIGDALWLMHRESEARAAQDSAMAADSASVTPLYTRVWMRLRNGDKAGARADAEAAVRLSPPSEAYWGQAASALVAAADGDTAKARRLMAQATAQFATRPLAPISAQPIIFGLAAAGQRELALEWLERVQPRGVEFVWSMQYPPADLLRSDPRFLKVMREAGASDQEIRGPQ